MRHVWGIVVLVAALFGLASAQAQTPTTFGSFIANSPAATPPTPSDSIPIVQAGSTHRLSATALLPTVPNNATLETYSTVNITAVVRQGFAAANDGTPPQAYIAGTTACSLNAGAGDGGSQVPSADGKCWLAVFDAPGADAREWGADITGTTDSTTALNACLTAVSNCLVPAGATVRANTASVTVPAYHALTCSGYQSDNTFPSTPMQFNGATIAVSASPSHPLTMAGNESMMQGCRIVPYGMTFPQTSSAGWVGTGISVSAVTGVRLLNVRAMGFDVCLSAPNGLSLYQNGNYFDCNGGNIAGTAAVVLGNGANNGTLHNVKLLPMATGGGCPARLRSGIGILFTGANGYDVDNVVITDYGTADFKVNNSAGTQIGKLWTDYGCAGGNTSTGVIVTDSVDTTFLKLDLNGTNTGVAVNNQQNSQYQTHFGDVFASAIAGDVFDLGLSAGTAAQQAGGTVTIVDFRTNTFGSIGGFAVNYLDTHNGNTKLNLLAGSLVNLHSMTAPYLNIPSSARASDLHVAPMVFTDLAAPQYLMGTPTVACTGLDTGSCSLAGSNNTQAWPLPYSGVVELSPTGSPSASGGITITFPFKVNWPICTPALNNGGTASWDSSAQAPVMTPSTPNMEVINWAQTPALTAGKTYEIQYSCQPQ